jgi:hypothetical protein
MGALMTRDEIAEAHQAALARKRHDRTNTYRAYSDAEELQARLEGRRLERVSIYAPEFKDPESAADWWDDRILERNSSHWGFPEVPVLFAVAVAARDGGPGAAREAVRAARQLQPAVQWTVYRNFQLWAKHETAIRFGADQVVGQVLAEWERMRLPTEDPAPKERPPRRQRRWEIETEAAS